MKEHIKETFMAMRKEVERASRKILMGKWAGEKPENRSLIANYFAKPEFFLLADRLNNDLAGFEE